MAKYRVCGHVSAGKYLGVFEADSKDEAIEKALNSEEACVSLCHHCSGEAEDPEIHEATADLVDEATLGEADE